MPEEAVLALGPSWRERICQYFVDQLSADGRPDGLLVDRQRSLPLDASLLPAALVYLARETTERIGALASVVRREVVLRVELRAAGEPTDQILDPLITWVNRQLMSDYTVGGLADSIHEVDSEWGQAATQDIVVGAVSIDFKVTYRTLVNDPIGEP